MRAAWYENRGPASDVLNVGDLPTPSLQPGEVLVRIRATAVNPSDTKSRSGAGARANSFTRIIPHQDGAGVIEAVGEGVDASRIGERVWIYEAQLNRPFGCAADYTAVPSINAVALPDNTSFEEGACLGVPAMTAYECVMADGPVADKVVLVTGGAGAVGFYAIQFARLQGATVITTVSTEEQAKIARHAGATHVIFRKTEDIAARIAEITGAPGGRGVDRIVEVSFGANLDTSLKVLRPGGVIATYASDQVPEPALPFWPLIALCVTVRFVLVYLLSREAHDAAIAAITEGLKNKQLKHSIASRYSLDQIVAAHEAQESGKTVGKIIVTLARPLNAQAEN